MTLPSKELLSKVLKVDGKIVGIGTIDVWNCLTFYVQPNINIRDPHSISIYELQHKMKEWALEQNHCFYSGIGEDECVCFIDFFEGNLTDSLFYETYLTAPTEFEAITQACEWVLKNKDKQC